VPDWRDRFRAPAVISAKVAELNHDRGVVITDVDDKFQAYAWDRTNGSIRAVTDSKGAVTSTAISHDGEWIYAMVEKEVGTEIGHVHRFSFAGDFSEDVTPDLPYFTSFEFVPTPTGLAAIGGVEGRQALIVVDHDGARVFSMPSLATGLAVTPDGGKVAVTMSTPGKGLVPMTHVLDAVSGEVLDEVSDMSGGAIYGDTMAVAFVDGDWMRPGLRESGVVMPIDTDIPGDVIPVDWARDGSTVLLVQSYRAKTALFLYEVATARITELARPPGGIYPQVEASLITPDVALSIWSDSNNPWRVFVCAPDEYRLALELEEQRTFPGPEWEEVTFPSAGIDIQGWLLRPEGDGPWPTVLYTHGGPTSVAGPMFSPICSAWFDAGFAVASINYRGSTTFGESFREALTGNLGGPDIDDVVAARQWLVDDGVADPDRIVKNGYSYGGYLTLQSLGTHPELWAAGVAGAPIADWQMSYEDSNDVLKGYFISLWGGTPDQLGDAVTRGSPSSYVSDYQAPVLISQPEGDSRTPIRPVQQFVDDLKANGKDVDLTILKGGHAGSGINQMIEMVETWLEFATEEVGLGKQVNRSTPQGKDHTDQ
jgi:dipeptidyl aminopeptidase/acylaminoacyl peptidase